jgi:hypothetical protein
MRPFSHPQPFASVKDVFRLRARRMVSASRRISLFSHEIQISTVPLYENVDVHMVPSSDKGTMEVCIWRNRQPVHSVAHPLHGFTVHL